MTCISCIVGYALYKYFGMIGGLVRFIKRSIYKVSMNVNNVKRGEIKSVSICVKITPSMRKWLKENKFSPTLIFNEACKELVKK